MKKGTEKVVEILNNTGIKTIMATGDNIFTAITIGQQCNILSK